MSLAETPEFLESAGRRLFAVRRTPSGAARGAVVLCHAFGEEKKSSHRNLVEAARLMAERGFASLTPDLTGCGDSDGSLADATIEAWMGDLAVAQEHLARHVTAGVPLFLLGLRLGASLAALAAAARPNVAGLALWHPVVNGRAAFAADLRRTLIKQMLTDGANRVTRDELLNHIENGEGRIDFDGFPLTGALYRGIAAIDLTAGPGYAGPVFLAQVSHNETLLPETEALAKAYLDRGAPVEVRALTAPPLWARIDRVDCPELAEATLQWLESVCGGGHG